MSQADQSVEWFLARDGQQHGPISAAEMDKIRELGYLLPNDLVWRQGLSDWQPASSVFPPKPAPETPPAPTPAVVEAAAPAAAARDTTAPVAAKTGATPDRDEKAQQPAIDRGPAAHRAQAPAAKATDPRDIIAQ
jgi:hypothetical protein